MTNAEKLAAARAKFGGPFAHEPGTKWAPRPVLLLTAWLAERVRPEDKPPPVLVAPRLVVKLKERAR